MKPDIHPKYFENATITCQCGEVFNVGSTKETISTEICSKCHPTFNGSGKEMLRDSDYAVQRFQALMKRSAAKKEAIAKAQKNKKIKTKPAEKTNKEKETVQV